ncbi:MAG: hypothetical protein Satyrvirus25_11 [Satyrvirus sp.]|uniref:Uncharacterized protein n=1 Tax=Satyrvirus sp. TaxID=2487771 RepID=A0A3G5AEF8_9VIRU|nr:MAG: hypothetical protein Satyrvirus25_11 [Satyrvirus sp.]
MKEESVLGKKCQEIVNKYYNLNSKYHIMMESYGPLWSDKSHILDEYRTLIGSYNENPENYKILLETNIENDLEICETELKIMVFNLEKKKIHQRMP